MFSTDVIAHANHIQYPNKLIYRSASSNLGCPDVLNFWGQSLFLVVCPQSKTRKHTLPLNFDAKAALVLMTLTAPVFEENSWNCLWFSSQWSGHLSLIAHNMFIFIVYFEQMPTMLLCGSTLPLRLALRKTWAPKQLFDSLTPRYVKSSLLRNSYSTADLFVDHVIPSGSTGGWGEERVQ